MDPPIRPVLLLPFDPDGPKIGGIRTFAEGFVTHAPPDVKPMVVGVTSSRHRALGVWTQATMGSRELPFLPIVRTDQLATSWLPISARFGALMFRWRGRLPHDGVVMQIHRPATDLAIRNDDRPRIRVIHNPSADLSATSSESMWRFMPRMLNRVEAMTLGQMDLIYAIGDATADRYRESMPALSGRIKAISNWYDERTFHPPKDAEERQCLRAALGLDKNAEMVLYVARLERQKDPGLLVESFLRLAAIRPRAVLVLLGDGALRRAVQTRLERRDDAVRRVKFEGVVQQGRVAEMMRAADVLCISSVAETGPTVALEALASGLPVATTSVGIIAKIIGAHTDAGAVARERSADALAAAIAAVLDRPWRLRSEASIHAARPFSASVVLAPIYDDHRKLVHAAQ